jgi:hypothetical protein
VHDEKRAVKSWNKYGGEEKVEECKRRVEVTEKGVK